MTWTNDELQQLATLRRRKAAARFFRAVCTGLAIVAAIRMGIGYGIAGWLLGLVIAHAMEPELPANLVTRARELDRQRAGRG